MVRCQKPNPAIQSLRLRKKHGYMVVKDLAHDNTKAMHAWYRFKSGILEKEDS